MRRSFVGSIGWSGSVYASLFPLPLVSRTNVVQPCAFCSSCVLSQIFVSNQPSTPGAEGRPQHVVLVEVHVTRAEARVDRRGLLGLRIVELELAAALRDRERLGRRMIRSGLTPRQRLRSGGFAMRPTHDPGRPSRSCACWSGCSRSLRRPSTATAAAAACSRRSASSDREPSASPGSMALRVGSTTGR